MKEKEKGEEEASPTIDTDERILNAALQKFETEFNKKYVFDIEKNEAYKINDEKNVWSKKKEMEKWKEETKMFRITEMARMNIKKFADKDDIEQENPSEMEIRKIRERWYMDY